MFVLPLKWNLMMISLIYICWIESLVQKFTHRAFQLQDLSFVVFGRDSCTLYRKVVNFSIIFWFTVFRDEIGIMSCDDISKFGKPGMKGSESPNYFLEHESGKYYTLIEGEGHPVGSEYERSRATGVRRREKTPTHGRLDFCNIYKLTGFINCAINTATPPNICHSLLDHDLLALNTRQRFMWRNN